MEQEICPKCEKVVYDAEGFPAGRAKSDFTFGLVFFTLSDHCGQE